MPRGRLHIVAADLAEFDLVPPGGTWNMIAYLEQYLRLVAEWQDYLAERGEVE